jgi:hypothetical protein
MDIKKPTKTHQAKRVEYVVLELAVLPRLSYSIKTTSVVAASLELNRNVKSKGRLLKLGGSVTKGKKIAGSNHKPLF